MVSGINNSNGYISAYQNINSDEDYFKITTKTVKETFLKKYTDSYAKTDDKSSKELDKEIKSLMSSADNDKSGGLSRDELASIDTKGSAEKDEVVKDLIKNFQVYDTNNDNELSPSELKNALKKLNKQFSEQDIAKIAQENKKHNNSNYSLGCFSNIPEQNLLSLYQGNDSSLLESSLNISV